MNTAVKYQRARSLEQKEERRAQLLDMTRTLLLDHLDTQDLSLNELARRAGMTKSNVYRYFESREAVLLELLSQEWGLWFADLRKRLDSTGACTIEQIVQALASTVAKRPLLCRLTSILPSIIEHNVTIERVSCFKSSLLALSLELAHFFHNRVPSVSQAAFEEFVHHAITLLIGLWPLSHPSPMAVEVLKASELAPLRYDFESDFARALLLLLRGLSAA